MPGKAPLLSSRPAATIGTQGHALNNLGVNRRNRIAAGNHEADFLIVPSQVRRLRDQRITLPALRAIVSRYVFKNTLAGFWTCGNLMGVNFGEVRLLVLLIPAHDIPSNG